MKRKFSTITAIEWVIFALTFVSVSLLVVAFIVPPPAQIDSSVIVAVSELFAFSALLTGLYAIKRGADAKIKHGEIEVEINNPDNDGQD